MFSVSSQSRSSRCPPFAPTRKLGGFYGIPQYNIKPWMALFAAKPTAKVSQFGFADAGFVRDSKSGSVTESRAFAFGGGATYKFVKAPQPAAGSCESVGTYAAPGNRNKFTALRLPSDPPSLNSSPIRLCPA